MHIDWTINLAALLQLLVLAVLIPLARAGWAILRELGYIRERLVRLETVVGLRRGAALIGSRGGAVRGGRDAALGT